VRVERGEGGVGYVIHVEFLALMFVCAYKRECIHMNICIHIFMYHGCIRNMATCDKYAYMYIYIYICIYIYVICVYMYMSIHINIYKLVNVYIRT